MEFTIETEREDDGRWIAEVREIPGALVYGRTEAEAVERVKALARAVMEERREHGEADDGRDRRVLLADGDSVKPHAVPEA